MLYIYLADIYGSYLPPEITKKNLFQNNFHCSENNSSQLIYEGGPSTYL